MLPHNDNARLLLLSSRGKSEKFPREVIICGRAPRVYDESLVSLRRTHKTLYNITCIVSMLFGGHDYTSRRIRFTTRTPVMSRVGFAKAAGFTSSHLHALCSRGVFWNRRGGGEMTKSRLPGPGRSVVRFCRRASYFGVRFGKQ